MASAATGRFSQFNFLVDLGDANGPHAGFQEVSDIEKISGLNKATDVTLKRGVISSSTLEGWLNQIRKTPKRAPRRVKITMQDETHRPVCEWTLLGAVIIKYDGPALNAKGTDVAIDELVLSGERIE